MKRILFFIVVSIFMQTMHGVTENDLQRTIVSMNTRIFDTKNLYAQPLEASHISLWNELITAMNTYVTNMSTNVLLVNSVKKATKASQDLFSTINHTYALLHTEKNPKVLADIVPLMKEKFTDMEKIAQEIKIKLTRTEFQIPQEKSAKNVLVLFVSYMRFQAKKAREQIDLNFFPK